MSEDDRYYQRSPGINWNLCCIPSKLTIAFKFQIWAQPINPTINNRNFYLLGTCFCKKSSGSNKTHIPVCDGMFLDIIRIFDKRLAKEIKLY
jgi:hypothetical protein